MEASRPSLEVLPAICIAFAVFVRLSAAGDTSTNASSTGSNRPLPNLPRVERPHVPQPSVGPPGDVHLDKSPPRETVGLDLIRNRWSYNCMECHKLLTARWHYDRLLNEHQDVQLEHGNNRFCLNCHHPTNRNAFADYDGSEIAEADVVQLCAKCHGTVYRDWNAGVHGRENGFWKAGLGEKSKLRCIQCHDPHSPRFKSMQPLPPLRYPSRGAHPLASASGTIQPHDSTR